MIPLIYVVYTTIPINWFGGVCVTRMWDEIREEPKVMEGCITENIGLVRQIVDAIRIGGIDRIMIAARGTSDHAAVYGKYIMEILLGIPVTLAAPSVFTVYHGSLRLANTLVIGISQSGQAVDVLEVLQSAKASGALTLGITNNPESPVALEAHYHLNCSAGAEISVAATKTFMAEIALLAVLTSVWAGDDSLLEEIGKMPARLEALIHNAHDFVDQVERYRYMEECFVLARGVTYAIALEGALKIQETCYVRAKAYATSDFYHGPYAMIEKGTPVMVLAPRGPALNDVRDMAHRLKASGAELIMVSDDEELGCLGDSWFKIPEVNNDVLSPFLTAAVAQIFACSLALVKGLNPDKPRSLNKVTITR